MDKEQTFYASITLIVATAITLVIGGLIFAGILAGNNDHDFDRTCIASGKSVEQITLKGSDSVYKVCQK